MLTISDDLNLYTNKKFRSSELVIEVWEMIESELLYSIGMTEKTVITLYIDNDSILLVIASEEHEVLCSVIRRFNINHSLTSLTDLAVTVVIDFNTSNNRTTKYDRSSFYFERGNREDAGSIDVECVCFYDIDSYDDFKLEVITTISEELQFLIHRNILNSDIENCGIANIDSKFEVVKVCCQIKNKSFDESIKECLHLNKINSKEALNLIELIRRISNE
jgi:hypothetical protein